MCTYTCVILTFSMYLDYAIAAEYKSRYCCSLASIIFRWPEALKTYVKQKKTSRVLIFIENLHVVLSCVLDNYRYLFSLSVFSLQNFSWMSEWSFLFSCTFQSWTVDFVKFFSCIIRYWLWNLMFNNSYVQYSYTKYLQYNFFEY